MTRRRAAVIGGLLLSVLLLWWALRDVSPRELWLHMWGADPWLLAAAVAVATGSFALRAVRWRWLLEPVLPGSTFRNRFSATCIGFMGNNLLPLRLGEFARIYAFSRTEPIGMSATLASLVVERLFDGLMLVLLLGVAMSTPQLAGQVPPLIRSVTLGASVGVILGLLLLWLVVLFPERLLTFFRLWLLRPIPERFAVRITEVVTAFIGGLGALGRPSIFFRVLGWSAVIWLWNGASFWLAFLAFDIHAPGFPGALFLQSVIALAVSVPSSPGFFGPFEAGARIALEVYGVAPARIMGYVASYHLLTFIPVTLLGLWFAQRLGISLSEVGHSEEYVEAAVEGGDDQVGVAVHGGGRRPNDG